MRGNRGLFLVVEIICVISILFCGFMMLDGDRFAKKYRIYAIVDEADNEDRQSLKSGMRSAAEENNIELVIVGTEEAIDTQDSGNIILREKDNIALEAGVGINMVEFDNYSLGKVLGDVLVSEFAEDIKEKRISIICRSKALNAQKTRLEGFKEVLNENGVKEIKIIEIDNLEEKETDSNYIGALKDVIVALDNKSLLAAGNYTSDFIEHPTIYGIGSSVDSIYLLEKNYINGIVFPDEYKVGYRSVELAIDKMNNRNKGTDSLETEYKVITKENLYSPENEGILLTFSR